MKRLLIAAAALCATLGFAATASAENKAAHPHAHDWAFAPPLGKFDQRALQRGFQVYKEVCASCHSLKLMSYRMLGEPGGPLAAHAEHNAESGEIEYKYGPDHHGKVMNPNENPFVKAVAAEYEVAEIDPQTGMEVTRPGRPSDKFHSPFANDGLARAANGGAVPPDFSVLSRARHGGADYIAAFADGFREPPAGLELTPGKHYNIYMKGDLSGFWKGDPNKVPPGGFVSMPAQLTPDRVTYADGTKATPEQMASDVAVFLAWTADPKLELRHSLGLQVMIYLLILTVLVYLAYRQVWKDTKH